MDVSEDQRGFSITGVGVNFVDTIVIPETYSYFGTEYPVVEITANAFADCEELINISIPNSVKTIGEAAFSGCTGLTSVNIPDNLMRIEPYTFYQCKSLTSVLIPNSVRMIYDHAFAGCTALTNVQLPNNLAIIDEYAFDGCVNLSGALVAACGIRDYAFRGTGLQKVTLNENSSVGVGAFNQCKSLTEVTFPQFISLIGEGAFADCTSLTKVTMPEAVMKESMQTLADRTFYNCVSLADINLSTKNLNFIGAEVFYNCDSLTSLTVPDNIARLGEKAFYDCDRLERVDFVYVAPTVYNEMGGCRIGASTFADCDNLTTLYFSEGSYKFDADAFAGCENLKDVYIEDILLWATSEFVNEASSPMRYAENLYLNGEPITGDVHIGIGGSEQQIIPYAFKNCSGITSVSLPSNLTKIGTNAFEGCTALERIIFPGTMAQWELVEKEDWNNGLGSCVVDCWDGDITVG